MIVYYHNYKPYRIFAHTKFKVNRRWIDCVIYQTLYTNQDGWLWVRTKNDFYRNFTRNPDTKIEDKGEHCIYCYSDDIIKYASGDECHNCGMSQKTNDVKISKFKAYLIKLIMKLPI